MSFFNGLETILMPVEKKRAFTDGEVNLSMLDVQVVLGSGLVEITHVGSSYIMGEGKDLDIVALVKYPEYTRELLICKGYILSSNGSGDGDRFCCFRRDHVNLMITEDRSWYNNFVLSAEVCKALHLGGVNMTNKEYRIIVHRTIMDHEAAADAVRNSKGHA